MPNLNINSWSDPNLQNQVSIQRLRFKYLNILSRCSVMCSILGKLSWHYNLRFPLNQCRNFWQAMTSQTQYAKKNINKKTTKDYQNIKDHTNRGSKSPNFEILQNRAFYSNFIVLLGASTFNRWIKDQLISKCLIGSIVSTKKPTKFF